MSDRINRAEHRRQPMILLIVMLACAGFQTALGLYLGYWQHLEDIKSFAGDTKTYYEVANWLLGDLQFERAIWSVATRPIGYPLILGLCDRIAPGAIVLVQIIFWCLAQTALFSIVRERSGSLRIALVITAISVTCLGFAVLPFVALTDTLAIALTVFGLYFAHRYDAGGGASNLILLLSSMSLGVMMRPSSMYPLIMVSMGVLVALWKKKKYIGIAVLCLLPVLAQIGLLYKHFGIAKISIIDSLAFDQYLLSRTDAYLHRVSLPLAREIRRKVAYYPAVEAHKTELVAQYDKYAHNQLWNYLLNVPDAVSSAYSDNLAENMASGSGFLEIRAQYPVLSSISLYQNILLSYGGILLALFSFFLTGVRILRGTSPPLRQMWLEIFVAGLILYFLLISGISYWQGDRLTLPAHMPALILAGMWMQKGFYVNKI